MGMAANRVISLILTIIVLALMVGGLTAIAYFLGVYLLAFLSLVLVVLYNIGDTQLNYGDYRAATDGWHPSVGEGSLPSYGRARRPGGTSGSGTLGESQGLPAGPDTGVGVDEGIYETRV